MIVLKGGEVLTPAGWEILDVAMVGNRVSALGTGLSGDSEIEATGCLVGPGFVDMHTHLRDPGQTWKEDIVTGTRAAAAGGFTAITAMPNTDPALDRVEVVRSTMSRAAEVGLVRVVPSAALTVDRAGRLPTDLEALYELGVRLFTDDGDSVADSVVLEEIMGRIASLPGAFVAQHAEDNTLTRGGQMHDGPMSRQLGVAGLPTRAETDVVARDLELVSRTGARYHCQHVSSAETVVLLEEARRAGLPVTSEVTPHHLSFDQTRLGDLDPNFKMYPPLRETSDRVALVEALRTGIIDVVATDHAPHRADEKEVGFEAAPRGVIGLETAAAATWMALSDRDRLFSALSTEPARLLGLADHGRPVEAGVMANLVVFDPQAPWVVDSFSSKSANSPYLGQEMTGRVRATVFEGMVVHSREKEPV